MLNDMTQAAHPVTDHPLEAEDPAAMEHVKGVVEASRTSFLWAMKLLERPRREAMYAVYCFCREVDDVADEPAAKARKIEELKAWREEIESLYEGRPRGPTARALAGPVAAFGMAKEDFLALIDGMEMDALETLHGPSMAELELYCDRVACAVGRLSVRAFGEHSQHGVALAFALGQALQLTNILRDVTEDAERGRLYLPAELLDRHGVTSRQAHEVLTDPGLAAVCEDLAVVARQRFDEAEWALKRCDRRAVRPAVVMKEVYRRILDRLAARGWHRLDEPVRVPTPTKLWIALRYGLL